MDCASFFHGPPTLQIWCVFPGIVIGPEGATSFIREQLSYNVVALAGARPEYDFSQETGREVTTNPLQPFQHLAAHIA